MPPPFQELTLEQFADLLSRFPFQRKINAVHMHHTSVPNRRQFNGQESVAAMWRHHTQVRRFRDIAQHITIAPDGRIWLGRNWNLPPASAAGHNGNRDVGPFMFEMVGDFNVGRDPFQDPQRDTALRVVALVQKRFGLEPEALRFHRELSSTDCPGHALDRAQIVGEVRQLHEAPRVVEGAPRGLFTDESPFPPEMDAINDVLDAFLRNVPEGSDPPDAEPGHERLSGGDGAARDGSGDAARSSGLSPGQLDTLRPHVINLNAGMFSPEGELKTGRGDVDAIFDDYLPKALEGARARGEKLRIVFYAHGGLVSESNGLLLAHKHVQWWNSNNVYPLYFIWETGLFETIGQLLRGGARRSLRRDVFDVTTDPVIETTARALYGPRIWGGMKRNAELAVGPDGGARYVAERLKTFCDAHGANLELHAVGHSAGSIFHAHFLPLAKDLGVPSFRSGHFLAPAIRVDTFHQRLGSRIGAGKGIDHLSIVTMRKNYEQDDHCANIYRKSLLYLIYYALEPERKTPILGLEINLRDDPALRRLFGLAGQTSPDGEVIWSVSPLATGRSASASTTHGGFDDDAPTMNSVARRVLGKSDTDAIAEFPRARVGESSLLSWEGQVDWPEEIAFPGSPESGSTFVPTPPIVTPVPPLGPAQPGRIGYGQQRRALCVGINRYSRAPLMGCVADAERWAQTLGGLGFTPSLLRDGAATRQAILDHLTALVTTSAPGDVVVFQYAGHGTRIPDDGGDEAGGDTGRYDEAICPFDIEQGGFLLDDDIADVFARIPHGVNVTCFIDCCHSGTISRFGVGAAQSARGQNERTRFLPLTPDLKAAHKRFRSGMPVPRALSARGPGAMREVLFSACRSEELAWETNEQGDFTRLATQQLQTGTGGLTNQAFQQRLEEAFGQAPRQRPELDCAPAAKALGLLQPLASSAVAASGPAVAIGGSVVPAANGAAGGNGHVDASTLAQALAQALAPTLAQVLKR